MTITPGIYEDISNQAYHSGEGYSATNIIDMADSFAKYHWKKHRPKKYTEALCVGSATHTVLQAALENDESIIAREILVLPDGIGYRSAKFPAICAANPGRTPVDQEDLDEARRMVDAVLAHPEAAGYLTAGKCEVSCYAFYPETSVLAKCRPDYLRAKDGLSINFKTARDASYDGFLRDVRDRRYDWQSAYYLDVLHEVFGRNFDEIHVVVEKAEEPGAPINIGVYTIDDEDLEFARAQYRQIIERIPECERTGIWPTRATGLQTVRLPNYARKLVTIEE